jgi:hypothetical protein
MPRGSVPDAYESRGGNQAQHHRSFALRRRKVLSVYSIFFSRNVRPKFRCKRLDTPQDRTILLEMALLWSRLAEIAATRAASPNEPTEPA